MVSSNIHDDLILVLDCGEATSVSSLIRVDLSDHNLDTVDHSFLFNLLLTPRSYGIFLNLFPFSFLISDSTPSLSAGCPRNWGHCRTSNHSHCDIFLNFLQEAYSVTVSYFGEQARTVPPNTFYSVFLRFIRNLLKVWYFSCFSFISESQVTYRIELQSKSQELDEIRCPPPQHAG